MAGGSRRVWVAPVGAFVGALVLAVFTVVANLANNTLAADTTPGWLHNPMILWPAVAVLGVLTAVLAGRAVRLQQADPGPGPDGGGGQSVNGVVGGDNFQIGQAGRDVNIGRRRDQKKR